ncbi:recombinase family protein [Novosphingobium sp.]|uniref:recombinase family protein n=1 Tax=Novosphingobium sp. TaxID=1874826 RepID=UPI003D0FE6FC
MKKSRCAIYTRKSSEEGLEQGFNSLDAQRESCAAYILSQASEGWTQVPDIYDDGGLSGGTLERPALRRLLADTAGGRIDIIVVYKVDRLTRSLLDFAKLVEALDKAGTSFVSITQSFNTTTSMGRLTLNMLLSFAQFEREVTAERIRDKIAASKAKGMWMGGTPPLGYKPDGRSLTIVEEHAEIIRIIYQRYLALGNVRVIEQQLSTELTLSPRRARINGKEFGGLPFSRGQLYSILKNPIYVGDIAHGRVIYAGQHQAIIDRAIWNDVQRRLADNVQGQRRAVRAANPSLLAGLIVDANGVPLISTHACKANVRYRYYVSHNIHHATSDAGLRIPAAEIEAAVLQAIVHTLNDPLTLATQTGLKLEGSSVNGIADRAARLAGMVKAKDRDVIRGLILTVRVQERQIEIDLAAHSIADHLKLSLGAKAKQSVIVTIDTQLKRTGRAVRLIQGDGAVAISRAEASSIKLLLKARQWWEILRQGELDVTMLAAREGVNDSYMTRVLRLAFLAPSVVDGILSGKVRAGIDAAALVATAAVNLRWAQQTQDLLPRSVA